MTPVILTDKNGDAKLITGASGGPKIITAVAQVNVTSYLDSIFFNACILFIQMRYDIAII